MGVIETMKPLMAAMKVRQDQLSLAGETLFRLFQSGSDELVAQVMFKGNYNMNFIFGQIGY